MVNIDYVKRVEEENNTLRQAINKLECENRLLEAENFIYVKWNPIWRTTIVGEELVIGKGTVIGEVACQPDGCWAVFIKGTRVGSYVSRSQAKINLKTMILETENG